MCCQNLCARCQERRHGSVSMLHRRRVSVSHFGVWIGGLCLCVEHRRHISAPLYAHRNVPFYCPKWNNQMTSAINQVFFLKIFTQHKLQEEIVGWEIHTAVRAHAARLGAWDCNAPAQVETSDWMGSPQTSRTGIAISSSTLGGMPFHRLLRRCLAFFSLFLQGHGENPRGHRRQVLKHLSGMERKDPSCSLPVDPRVLI